MEANHRDICKFPDEEHKRYLKVQNILLDLFRKHGQESSKAKDSFPQEALCSIQKMLGTKGASLEDHVRTSECRTLYSCRWILSNDRYNAWKDDRSPGTRILWVNGQPASGKSVLASFLIDHLRGKLREKCQFFYFRIGENGKEDTASLLRSIAYQVACEVPEFGDGLKGMGEDGIDFSKTTTDVLWSKLFLNFLFQLPLREPMYWIIDGVDESSSSLVLLTLLCSSRQQKIPLRIATFSRPFLLSDFKELKPNLQVDEIRLGSKSQDFRDFVNRSLKQFQTEDKSFLSNLSDVLLKHGDGNFLWVRQKLANIRYPSINTCLDISAPSTDLEGLYHQMARQLSTSWQGNDENLARTVLTWSAFSLRPIFLGEFTEIYNWAPVSIRELKNDIPRVCGEFVEIDAKFRVNLVHETARHFLTEVQNHRLHVNQEEAQLEIFLKCMETLNKVEGRIQPEKAAIGSFSWYAMTSWHTHLSKMKSPTNGKIFQSVWNFFCGQPVITWINSVAFNGQLDLLVDVSARVTHYLQYLLKTGLENIANSEQKMQADDLFQWTLDLENLVGHYGTILAQIPNAIYELIPPFCPKNSSIRKYSDTDNQIALRVTGLTNNQWTNLRARFPVTRGENLREVICGGRFLIATSTTMNGRFYVFDITTNRKLQEIEYGDPILATSLSHDGRSIAIYSPRQTKVWDICHARYIAEASNPVSCTILDIGFSIDDKVLFVCLDNGMVRKLSLVRVPQYWEHVIGPLKYSSGTGISRLPYCAAFSPGCNMLAVGYRRAPLSVWDIESATKPMRTSMEISRAEKLIWNPVSRSLLGILHGGFIFKESSNDQVQILEDSTIDVVCSPDGLSLVTSHSDGSLKLRKFNDLSVLHVFSESSICAGLTISRCGKRIYDIRDSFCYVWQAPLWNKQATPLDCLLKPPSDASTTTISKMMDSKRMVSAMNVCQATGIVLVGYTSGELHILGGGSKLLASLKPSGLPIIRAVWSESTYYLATADMSASVCVRRFNQALNRLENVFEYSAGTKVLQLLFNKRGTLLLIADRFFLTLLSSESGSIISRRAISSRGYLGLNHPCDDGVLLVFSPERMQSYLWNDLRELEPRNLSLQSTLNHVEETPFYVTEPEVKNGWTSRNKSLIVIQFTYLERHGLEKTELIFFDVQGITCNAKGDPLLGYSFAKGEDVQFPLGIVAGKHRNGRMGVGEINDRLAFVDWNGWVCSIPLERHPDGSDFSRHFVIPQAWMNRELLAMSQTLGKGTYFCPIDGEIAVLRGGFQRESSVNCKF